MMILKYPSASVKIAIFKLTTLIFSKKLIHWANLKSPLILYQLLILNIAALSKFITTELIVELDNSAERPILLTS